MKTKTIMISLIIFLMAFAVTTAKDYVSINGNFFIEYPDNWFQVDRLIVDQHLARSEAEGKVYDYDVLLSSKEIVPYYNGIYMIMSLEKTGQLNQSGIDSVLNSLSGAYGSQFRYYPSDKMLADLKSNAPVYDPDLKIVTIINEITQSGKLLKRNMIMKRFYSEGIATFHFYAPDSLFDINKQVFLDIVQSLNTENVDEHLPREKLEVADLSQSKKESSDDSGSSSSMIPIYAAFIGVILIVILIRRRKK